MIRRMEDSDHVFRRVPEYALRSLVPRLHDAIQVLADNRIVRRLDDGSETACGGVSALLHSVRLPSGVSTLHPVRGTGRGGYPLCSFYLKEVPHMNLRDKSNNAIQTAKNFRMDGSAEERER